MRRIDTPAADAPVAELLQFAQTMVARFVRRSRPARAGVNHGLGDYGDPAEAQSAANEALATLLGSELPEGVDFGGLLVKRLAWAVYGTWRRESLHRHGIVDMPDRWDGSTWEPVDDSTGLRLIDRLLLTSIAEVIGEEALAEGSIAAFRALPGSPAWRPRSLTIGSLFSGIGGLELGVEAALADLGRPSRVIWQAEKDPYARAVLAKHWPEVRRYEDVHDIDDRAERPDLICGGFPCQDLSIAGKRIGISGARSGLWSQYVRVVRVLRPPGVLVENVPELLGDLGHVLGPLAELGYDAEWDLFDAAASGAPHRRERLFLLAWRPGFSLANPDGQRQLQPPESGDDFGARPGDRGAPLADPARERREGWPEAAAAAHGSFPAAARCRRWPPEPDVGRVVDGPRTRLDGSRRRARLRCLGNGVVRQQACLAFLTLAARAGLTEAAHG